MSPAQSFAAPLVGLFGSEGVRLPVLDRGPRFRRSRGLIIDLDNTLYPLGRYTQSGFEAVASYVSATFGVPAEAAYLLLSRCAVRGEQATAFQFLCETFSLGAETVPLMVEVYRTHRPRIFLGEGARHLLGGLRADGWRLVVLTNGLPVVQARKVEALGLGTLVDHVIYAENVVQGGKPAPAAFREALMRLGTRPERTVCVGDDPRCDIAGARGIGLSTIRLAVGDRHVEPEMEADMVVESLSDVPHAATLLIEGVARHAA